jgi:rRNA-processing protein EBP2
MDIWRKVFEYLYFSNPKLVKGKLLGEKKRLEGMEERKKQRDQKKYSKQVQKTQQVEAEKRKKAATDTVTKWRKGTLC